MRGTIRGLRGKRGTSLNPGLHHTSQPSARAHEHTNDETGKGWPDECCTDEPDGVLRTSLVQPRRRPGRDDPRGFRDEPHRILPGTAHQPRTRPADATATETGRDDEGRCSPTALGRLLNTPAPINPAPPRRLGARKRSPPEGLPSVTARPRVRNRAVSRHAGNTTSSASRPRRVRTVVDQLFSENRCRKGLMRFLTRGRQVRERCPRGNSVAVGACLSAELDAEWHKHARAAKSLVGSAATALEHPVVMRHNDVASCSQPPQRRSVVLRCRRSASAPPSHACDRNVILWL